MIAHQVTLDYTLCSGWLAPFVDGLRKGDAMARRCETCAAVSFPPLRVCACGDHDGTWIKLPGTADIVFQTYGQDGHFGLVSFHGADTHTTLKLVDIDIADQSGQILSCPDDLPKLQLTTTPEKER